MRTTMDGRSARVGGGRSEKEVPRIRRRRVQAGPFVEEQAGPFVEEQAGPFVEETKSDTAATGTAAAAAAAAGASPDRITLPPPSPPSGAAGAGASPTLPAAAAAAAGASYNGADDDTADPTLPPAGPTSMPVGCLGTFAGQALKQPAGHSRTRAWASSPRIQSMTIVYMIFSLYYSAEVFDYKSLTGSSRASAISGLAHVAACIALLGCTAAWKLAALAGMGKNARGGRWDAVKGVAYMVFVRTGIRSVMDADASGEVCFAQAVAVVVMILIAPLCAYAENRILHFACAVGARMHISKITKKRSVVGGGADGGDSGLNRVLEFLDTMKSYVTVIIRDPHTLLTRAFEQPFKNSLEVLVHLALVNSLVRPLDHSIHIPNRPPHCRPASTPPPL